MSGVSSIINTHNTHDQIFYLICIIWSDACDHLKN